MAGVPTPIKLTVLRSVLENVTLVLSTIQVSSITISLIYYCCFCCHHYYLTIKMLLEWTTTSQYKKEGDRRYEISLSD
jgi:hypothetical protein